MKAETVIVRRRWNAPDTAEVGIDALCDLHVRDEPGGVCGAFPRAFLFAHVWCDRLPVATLAHRCRPDPPPPHELLVCILPADNSPEIYKNLRAKARG